MPVTIRCPKCRLKYQVREENLGARTKCKICGETFTIEMTADETAGFRPSGDASKSPLPADCSAGPKEQPRQETPPHLSPADPRAVPEKIGPYTVRRPLGGGAMGEVWLGWDAALQRDVAIKTLRREIALSPQGLDRFLREARLAAKLHHTNAVTVYQVGVEGQTPYIAMEYVEGQSLDQVVSPGRPMAWRQATRAVRDAAAGLDAAHKLGLIHRDIKPANLIRATDGVTKVVDFGLARVQAAQTQLTQQGSILGTPAYMAPEVWRRNETDARSDLYALTCTYYCLLTGEPPFDADNPVALGYQHTHEPLPDPRQRVPDLPNAVCRVLAKGASKDPQDRYQTAAAMLQDLEALLAASPQSLMSGLWMEADELPSLQNVDLLGPGDSGALASAVENPAPRAPARTRPSPDQLRRVQRFAHQPKTLREHLEGVGQPILIGAGGGLLLVLAIILLFLFSGSPTPTEVTRGRAVGVGASEEPSQSAGPAGGSLARDGVETGWAAGPSQVQPELADPVPQPEPAPAEPPKPMQEPEMSEAEPQQAAEQPTTGPGPDDSRPKQKKGLPQQPEPYFPDAVPGKPAEVKPSALTKPEPATQSPESTAPPEVAKPVAEPAPTPVPPAAPQKPPLELLAELTECTVEVKIGGDPKNVPKELASGLAFLAQSIRTKLQTAERTLDLTVVDKSDKAVMEVVMTPSFDPPHLVLNLKAELKCWTSDGGSVVVWSADSQNNPKPEIFRFIPAQFNPSLTPKLWEEKVIDFFKPLGKDHRDAKNSHGK